MTRILVPTDFSDTSRNAVRYAFDLANDLPEVELTLFNSFDKVVGSDGTPLASDPEAHRQLSLVALHSLAKDMNPAAHVNIRTIAEEGSMISNVVRLTRNEKTSLVIMGINGATRMEQILIGSTTLKLIEEECCPVLVIPPDAKYKKIRTVVYASDMKNVKETTPITTLREILAIFSPKIYVVNVDVEHYVEITEEYKKERADMDVLLQGYNPHYAFIRLYDFTEAIHSFALDHEADMIITVPRKHNFLEKIFTSSHTSRLAYHTHVPLLAIHE
jgi:nucleotide-binding universal stress UspA family protein